MLGYMTAKEALSHGFTHHGKYFGIPIWMSDNPEAPMIATKWAPMEFVMTAFHYIEAFIQANFFPEREPGFQFWMGQPIDRSAR